MCRLGHHFTDAIVILRSIFQRENVCNLIKSEMKYVPFYLPLSCACVRASVCEDERVWVFFVCLFCMPCVERVWMFFVLSFYVIYSRTIASIANVFCWLYPTLNKVYHILSYLILLVRLTTSRLLGHMMNFKVMWKSWNLKALRFALPLG